jgi:hypothetical protein
LEGKLYYDWVVTTAFYSSIHLVEDKLLPIDINGVNCGDILSVKRCYRIPGRHAARERLVIDNMDIEIAIKYKWLDDRSRYARYVTYKINAGEANKANQYLKDIYNKCV